MPLNPRSPPLGLMRSEEHTSELQSLRHLVCRLLLEKKQPRKKSAVSDAKRCGDIGSRGLCDSGSRQSQKQFTNNSPLFRDRSLNLGPTFAITVAQPMRRPQ